MLIGIAGRKQSGKTTSADALCNIGFSRESFADTLKEVACVIFNALGYSKAQVAGFYRDKEAEIPGLGVSLRVFLQSLGTDWGRKINPDLWVKCVEHKLGSGCLAVADIVFDDVRFENEAAFIRRNGGVIVHLSRPNGVNDTHESEKGIAVFQGDVVVKNTGSIDDLLDSLLGIDGLGCVL